MDKQMKNTIKKILTKMILIKKRLQNNVNKVNISVFQGFSSAGEIHPGGEGGDLGFSGLNCDHTKFREGGEQF